MQINLQVRFTLETNKGQITLCFKHAVQAAVRGDDVQQEIDDFGSTGETRTLHCRHCYTEGHRLSET